MPRVPAQNALHANALLREIVRLFVQAQRAMTECCTDATAQECQALLLLGGRKDPCTVQEFAERMGLEKTWASRLLGRMEQRGHLRRRPHPTDGRSRLLELTPRGRRELDALERSLNEHAVSLLGCVRPNVERALVVLRDALATCLASCPPARSRPC